MERKRLEEVLVENAAPTLAGLKCANLFSYFFFNQTLAEKEIERLNKELNPRGLILRALLWRETNVLLYAYRPLLLSKNLGKEEVRELLMPYGYLGSDMEDALLWLEERLRKSACFPHEIGVFLGYPTADVKGFIENGGKNCKCCGLWKVYCNEGDSTEIFHKLNKCTDVYMRVFREGMELTRMTVPMAVTA